MATKKTVSNTSTTQSASDLQADFDKASVALDDAARRLAGIRTLLREAVQAHNDATAARIEAKRALVEKLRQGPENGHQRADDLEASSVAEAPARPAPRPLPPPPVRRVPAVGPFGMDPDEMLTDTAPDLSVVRRRG